MNLASLALRLSFRQIQPALPPHPSLSALAHLPENRLPCFVRASPVAMHYLHLLGGLDWDHFPDRPDQRFSPNDPPLSYIPVVAAYLVKLEQHLPYVADLREYLVTQPALVWVLGFPPVPATQYAWGFDVDASLPTHRHLSRLLRSIPNASLQYLLDDTVRLIQAELGQAAANFGDCISLDTKHIIAWVKENNPKAYVSDRYDKTKQPSGDPDCKLGCKRRHNQAKVKGPVTGVEGQPTPTTNPVPAQHLKYGEYYWGYGSGVVATKVAEWGEFILAELTQSFDQADVTYFQPLMATVERRLGRKPRYGAFDATFDAFYVYEYFADGFAAVPLVQRGGQEPRQFSPDNRPVCQANLPMCLRYTYQCRTTRIPHERARYACPLRYPIPSGQTCPVQHKNWAKGGCFSTIATSPGARLRYQIDRDSETYKTVYRQRTATERVNSQAVSLGIERPKLRNGASIANHNTLTYVLINLHALQRVRQRKATRTEPIRESVQAK